MTSMIRERRLPKRRNALCALAAITVFSLTFVTSAQQTDRAKNIGRKVKCVCGGCEDTASTCNHTGGEFSGPCDTAKTMLKEIDARIARGESDDMILQNFVQEYGPTVLIEPPKKGFSWMAWIVPVVLPLWAMWMVWNMVRRWRERAALAPAGGPSVSADLVARARSEAEKERDE